MLYVAINDTMLRKLYNWRPDHYSQLNYKEWLFAMLRVEGYLVETDRNFFMTQNGIRYFKELNNE